MDREEREYLENYDIADYDRPSIAVDMAVFTISDNNKDNTNYRKLPDKRLQLLMIKRGQPPYKDMWALPGGFCKKGETVYEAALRELKEETGTDSAYLEMCNVFSEEGRDPRGWIISQAFMALMNSNLVNLKAGGDAWEAEWFDVELKKSHSVYELKLQHNEVNIRSVIKEKKLYRDYHESVEYEIVESEGIAFDHGKIIIYILNKLRDKVETDGKIVFDLMPEYFTLTDLQKVFEIIMDKKMLTANFRRKISQYVTETDKIITGCGHRPARMFIRNMDAFYKND